MINVPPMYVIFVCFGWTLSALVWLDYHTVEISVDSLEALAPLSKKPLMMTTNLTSSVPGVGDWAQMFLISESNSFPFCATWRWACWHADSQSCACASRVDRAGGWEPQKVHFYEKSKTGLIRVPAKAARLASWGTPQPEVGGETIIRLECRGIGL